MGGRSLLGPALGHKKKVRGGTGWEEGLGPGTEAEPRDTWDNCQREVRAFPQSELGTLPSG